MQMKCRRKGEAMRRRQGRGGGVRMMHFDQSMDGWGWSIAGDGLAYLPYSVVIWVLERVTLLRGCHWSL